MAETTTMAPATTTLAPVTTTVAPTTTTVAPTTTTPPVPTQATTTAPPIPTQGAGVSEKTSGSYTLTPSLIAIFSVIIFAFVA